MIRKEHFFLVSRSSETSPMLQDCVPKGSTGTNWQSIESELGVFWTIAYKFKKNFTDHKPLDHVRVSWLEVLTTRTKQKSYGVYVTSSSQSVFRDCGMVVPYDSKRLCTWNLVQRLGQW